MDIGTQPLVLRLGAVSRSMTAEERAILGTIGANVVELEATSEAEIRENAEQADAVMIVADHLPPKTINAMQRCRVIARMGIGTDKIDVLAATRKGIIITYNPGFCSEEVADHAVAMVLSIARKLRYYEAQMRLGKRPLDDLDNLHRLSACTLGIVGFGSIGRQIAARAAAFGSRILIADPAVSSNDALPLGVHLVGLGSLLAESDYIILACPLTPSTKGMIAMPQLRRMKRSAVLVNVGRGGLVIEQDLAAALRSGIIRYAATDVFDGVDVFNARGFATDHPFFLLDNIIMTPHIAARSVESIVDMSRRSAQAVVDVLSGRWPADVVNPDVQPWFPIGQPPL